MNFAAGDRITDLLSDNSIDDDSFFGNLSGENRKKSKLVENKGTGKMVDLFGIDEKVQDKQKGTKIQSGNLKATASSVSLISNEKPFKLDENEDDDDLGFDPKKPKAGAKMNLFDDLFSAMDTKKSTTTTAVMNRKDDSLKAPISRQSTDTTTDNSNVMVSQARPKTSTGRRSSGTSTIPHTDTLGLFGGQSRDKEGNASISGMSTPMTKKRGTTADWLGLSTEPEEKQSTVQMEGGDNLIGQTLAGKRSVEILKIPDAELGDNVTEMRETNENEQSNTKGAPSMAVAAHGNNILDSFGISAANALNVMQQQESQLTLIANLKNYERASLELQRAQDVIVQQQQRQYTLMMEQHMRRQHQFEEFMKLQQERFNNNVQLMLTETATISPLIKTEMPVVVETNRSETVEVTSIELQRTEADIKRLEYEKLHLEDLLEFSKKNYEKEIDLTQSLYKKEMKLLEEHQAVVENRMRNDNEDLIEYYSKKLNELQNENYKVKSDFENTITTLKQDHEDELRKVRKSQEEDIEMLKAEHKRMLEVIRQSKMLEFAAMQENGSYLEVLKMATDNLENMKGDIKAVRDDMQLKMGTLNKDSEMNLIHRERKVEDAEKRLKFLEESYDTEKKRLMELVSALECQLEKLTKESADDNWLVRQQMTTLEADKVSFEREKELFREQQKRDEKRLQDLKKSQLLEMEQVMFDLQEERGNLAAERAKFDTEKKLQSKMVSNNDRLELDVALQVAQDAANQANTERERYLQMQRQLEQQKRDLSDKQNILRIKESEIVQELEHLQSKDQAVTDAQKKAKSAEEKFIAKLTKLNQRLREVNEAESHVSEERAILAEERSAVNVLKAQWSDHIRKCTLCKMDADKQNVQRLLNGNATEAAGRHNLSAGNVRGDVVYMDNGDVVDHILDKDIAESYQKMRSSTNVNTGFVTNAVLDDDSKNLAMNTLDIEPSGGAYQLLSRLFMKD